MFFLLHTWYNLEYLTQNMRHEVIQLLVFEEQHAYLSFSNFTLDEVWFISFNIFCVHKYYLHVNFALSFVWFRFSENEFYIFFVKYLICLVQFWVSDTKYNSSGRKKLAFHGGIIISSVLFITIASIAMFWSDCCKIF